jgi:hypothetical protein
VGIYKRMNGNERYILLLSPYILIMFERNMNKNVILMREIECFTHFWVEHSKGIRMEPTLQAQIFNIQTTEQWIPLLPFIPFHHSTVHPNAL